MKNVDVLIIYEHKVRELESVLFLKRNLNSRNISAEIVQYRWSEMGAKLKYRPKIVLCPWCYDDIDYNYYMGYIGGYHGNRYKLVCMNNEQIGNKCNQEFMIPSGKTCEIYHFAWGEYYKNKLIENGVPDSHIFITGSPRLDFFKQKFANINKSREELSKEFSLVKEKKWLLIIGSFGGMYMDDSDLSMLCDRGYRDINEYKGIVVQSYNKIVDWIESVCQTSKIGNQFEIIYRPHPSEIITERIARIENNFDCFHINREYAIRDWIVNADKIYSWNSTSAIEALYAKKNCYFLRPLKIPEKFSVELLEKAWKIESCEEFIDSIMKDSTGKLFNEDFEKATCYYYSAIGQSSNDAMADAIELILNDDNEGIQTRYHLISNIKSYVKYIMLRVLFKTNLWHYFPRITDISNDLSSREEYADYQKRIERIGVESR